MDIAAYASQMALQNVQTAFGTAMLGKALDTSQSQAAELTQMVNAVSPAQMELSVNPAVGSNFDALI